MLRQHPTWGAGLILVILPAVTPPVSTVVAAWALLALSWSFLIDVQWLWRRAAGTEHGQEMPPEAMEAVIRSIGRVPRLRNTLYGAPSTEQRRRSFAAPPLGPVEQTPAGKYARIGGRHVRLHVGAAI